jgi:hypothetical protein
VGRSGGINEVLAGLFFGNPRPPKFSSVFLTLRTFVAVVASPYRSLAFEWGFERYRLVTTVTTGSPSSDQNREWDPAESLANSSRNSGAANFESAAPKA